MDKVFPDLIFISKNSLIFFMYKAIKRSEIAACYEQDCKRSLCKSYITY